MKTSKAGLSTSDVQERREIYGYNEIIERRENPVKKFLLNFWGPIPWMIEIAAILSALVKHWEDFSIIVLMLLINAGVRFWEEYRAENAVELLKKKLALEAMALRNGKWQSINAQELVPGDIVRIRLGDIIPADLMLFEGEYLTVDESALTGESLPVNKERSDVVYEGAIVGKGEMSAIVISIGLNTYFGKTTSLVSEAKKRSHFQQAVINIGNYLIVLAVILVMIVFVVGIVRGEKLLELLQFALVLIIAAIPVALPAVLMVSMAVGASDLAKKETITKRLLSIEELAGMDVLCSDKTGTITKNELSIGEIIPYNNFSEDEVITYGVMASRQEDNDPIDNVFFEKYDAIGGTKVFTTAAFIPFDPVSKRTEATIEAKDQVFKVTKGAIQVILSLIDDKSQLEPTITQHENRLAKNGFRVLAIARTDETDMWHFVGIIALYDPPRDDSATTIQQATDLGVDVKMVTGDHIAIARETATNLGMGSNFLSASKIMEGSSSDVTDLIEKADGYAEVYPEHKYQIVGSLQHHNHIVGMTGDGVNDAPALKKADVGIAVASATDAAKSAADIVLTSPGLSVIIDAIHESRVIFERMKSYTTYRIAETVRVLIFLVLVILLFKLYPITAIMIVILALLNDLPIMTIAFDNATPSNTPNRWEMNNILKLATFLGVTGVFFSFGLFLISRFVLGMNLSQLQTIIFLKLAVSGHMTIYLTRSKGHFWQQPYPAKILFFTSETTQIIATFFAAAGILMAPIGWSLALFVWGFAIGSFIITDLLKYRLM